MYVTGIDENGLGPRLGPMTTTAVTLSLSGRYDAGRLARRGLACGVTDSKATASSRRMAFAESVSLALIELGTKAIPGLASEVAAGLHLDGGLGLVAPCPDGSTKAMCHGHDLRIPAFGGDRAEGHATLRPLLTGRGAMRIEGVRSVVNCANVLNRAHAEGRNKLVLDLAAMERLTLAAARQVGEHTVIAGMIGGIRDVPKFASFVPRDAFAPQEETRSRRSYAIDGVGSLSFEVDADATHLPVALASIVGKYLRELGMARIVGFHREHDPGLSIPSGYHDPVTGRFVSASEPIRRRLAIAAECFERVG